MTDKQLKKALTQTRDSFRRFVALIPEPYHKASIDAFDEVIHHHLIQKLNIKETK